MSSPLRRALGRVKRTLLHRRPADCTLWPPPSYSRQRADAVYDAGFRRCFEYLTNSELGGDVLEFGCYFGYSSRWLATLMRDLGQPGRLYLYDSFQGFPAVDNPEDAASYEVAVRRAWSQGTASTGPEAAERIRAALSPLLGPERLAIVPGFYEATLSEPLASRQVALAHVDCDLYSSSRCVLDRLFADEVLQDGALLVFDDWNCNRANPRMGQRRALPEALAAQTRYACTPWFDYSWSGRVFFVHDTAARLEP